MVRLRGLYGRAIAATIASALFLAATGIAPASTAYFGLTGSPRRVVYDNVKLHDGGTATVYADGMAVIRKTKPGSVEYRVLSPQPHYGTVAGGESELPDRAHAALELDRAPHADYAPQKVVVVLRAGAAARTDEIAVPVRRLFALRSHRAGAAPASGIPPAYTNDLTLNRELASIGTDSMTRLFRGFNRSLLSAMHARTIGAGGSLDFSNAYVLHITNARVPDAVRALAKMPEVAYVEPDWTVAPMHAISSILPPAIVRTAQSQAMRMTAAAPREFNAGTAPYVPANYADGSSAQSLLNAPGVDAIAAFDEIDRHFHQLPGQGERITNVSLGDVDDAGAASNPNDPCNFYVNAYGPTTELVGGQHYIDWPSMPLIPAYTVDSSGNLSGKAEVCGADPELTEIGLDFSMMAPLPHERQRSGERGDGLTDLLGIAPGAQYRLVVPLDPAATIGEIQAALLAAALQTPRPDVITASIGYSLDASGFPSRFLEDDPLTEAIVASIVQNYKIAVCISANDGTRLFTAAAIGPSGGSAPTEVTTGGSQKTDLGDIADSTVPSFDFDSGSIDAGGTTLDDILADPPAYATEAAVRNNHTWAETRWTGFRNFSSGYGTRVDLAAPSDNVLALSHALDGKVDSVNVSLTGGTSASAPEVAAAAAVALQVARLTGHAFTSVGELRSFLATSGTVVRNLPEADRTLNVGPQVDVRRAVEMLLAKSGKADAPSVPRVAIEQRRDYGNLDAYFLSDTDPKSIDLQNSATSTTDGSDIDEYAWITLAPDWEFVPNAAKYRLFVTATPSRVLARTPLVRLLPATILAAAGKALASPSTRTVDLTYEATLGARVIAKKSFSLTFGPADRTTTYVAAPNVPPLVRGTTIPVKYDLANVRNVASPALVVSYPGRFDPASTEGFEIAYSVPLPNPAKGTVDVPVSALQGGGVYGIGIEFNTTTRTVGDFAYTRVQPPAASTSRPPAPLLSAKGSSPGHLLELSLGSSFDLSYDVRNVPGATGALLEISAAGPTAWGIANTFNNPNGTERDRNGVDSGSIYRTTLTGTHGTIALNAAKVHLIPTLFHTVRIIPMKQGVAVGEASDVSGVTVDGIVPPDGGLMATGLNTAWGGINESGNDGLLATFALTESNGSSVPTADLFTFDQTTGKIVTQLATNPGFYFNAQLFANDLGLAGMLDEQTFGSTYNIVQPVATATSVGAPWSPSQAFGLTAAPNQTSSTNAFILQGDPNYDVFVSQVAANTFGPMIDVSGPLDNGYPGVPQYTGFAQDTQTNTALLVGSVLAGSNVNEPPTLVTVNLSSGSVSSFTTTGKSYPEGLGLDAATGKAAFATQENCGTNPIDCDGLNLVDLATQTGKEVFVPGGFPTYVVNDPKAKEFVVSEPQSPDSLTNHNSLSSLLVYDENGRLVKTLEAFDMYGTVFSVPGNFLVLKPSGHTGIFLGPGGYSLEPFTY